MSDAAEVLVVDDDVCVRDALAEELGASFSVTTASSAEEGLAVLAEKSFDAIVSDVRMPGMGGVAFLKHVAELDPTIVRVGAIIGEGHEDLIEEAQQAAEEHGIDLRVQVTTSDQETLYFFRRMIRDIDGFWLFPDNRVLSGRALQEMLAEASRQHVPVNVPNESMLQLGAKISMSAVASTPITRPSSRSSGPAGAPSARRTVLRTAVTPLPLVPGRNWPLARS